MVRNSVRRVVGVVSAAAAVLLLAAAVHAGPVRFSLLELVPLGGESTVVALNNSGQVVGTSGALGPQRAFRTRPSRPFAPGDLLLDGPEENQGLALNDRGQAVLMLDANPFITLRTGPDAPPNRATDNIIPPGSPQLWPLDINNEGRVVGMILHGSTIGPTEVFRTGPGVQYDPATDDLGTLGGTRAVASAVNDAGVTVGTSDRADGRTHAFRVPVGRSIDPRLDDLGTLGGESSAAADINAAGRVVGSASTAAGATHAFRTAPGAAINAATDDLGVLPGMTASAASGINAAGDVVGTSSGPGEAGDLRSSRAFLFTDGRMFDLNDLLEPGTSDVFLNGAIAINDRGQILAGALFDTGGGSVGRAAVLLTPVVTAVPLPPGLVPGAAGLLCVAALQAVSKAHRVGHWRALSSRLTPE